MSKKQSVPINKDKMFVLQTLAEQRQKVQWQLQPFLKTSQRVVQLFSLTPKKQANHGRTVIVTTLALTLAFLGKRRGGWLGKIARYAIVNYPGLLHKFIK